MRKSQQVLKKVGKEKVDDEMKILKKDKTKKQARKSKRATHDDAAELKREHFEEQNLQHDSDEKVIIQIEIDNKSQTTDVNYDDGDLENFEIDVKNSNVSLIKEKRKKAEEEGEEEEAGRNEAKKVNFILQTEEGELKNEREKNVQKVVCDKFNNLKVTKITNIEVQSELDHQDEDEDDDEEFITNQFQSMPLFCILKDAVYSEAFLMKFRSLLEQMPTPASHIKSKSSFNQTDANGNTLLHLICGGTNAVEAKFGMKLRVLVSTILALIRFGVESNVANSNGNTALHFAVANELSPVVINTLLKVGFDPNHCNKKGKSPLHLAKERMLNSEVERILQLFRCSLHDAIEDGCLADIRRLLSFSCSIDAKCLWLATKSKNGSKILKILKSQQQNIKLTHYVLEGAVLAVKNLLTTETKLDVNIVDKSIVDWSDGKQLSVPLLAMATMVGTESDSREIVSLLLQHCPIPNVYVPITMPQDRCSMPLWYRLLQHFDEKCLLEEDESIIMKYHEVEVLLINGLEFNMAAQTQLLSHKHILRLWTVNRKELVRNLFSAGYAFWLPDSIGGSIREVYLSRILMDNKTPSAKALNDVIMKMDEFDSTIFEIISNRHDLIKTCAEHSYWPIFGEYVMNQINTEIRMEIFKWNDKYNNFLQLVDNIKSGNSSAFKNYATVDDCAFIDRNGRTLLHLAVIYDRLFILRHLLYLSKDFINVQDIFGRTCLHYAACYNDDVRATFQILLEEAGSKNDLLDNCEENPFRQEVQNFYDIQASNVTMEIKDGVMSSQLMKITRKQQIRSATLYFEKELTGTAMHFVEVASRNTHNQKKMLDYVIFAGRKRPLLDRLRTLENYQRLTELLNTYSDDRAMLILRDYFTSAEVAVLHKLPTKWKQWNLEARNLVLIAIFKKCEFTAIELINAGCMFESIINVISIESGANNQVPLQEIAKSQNLDKLSELLSRFEIEMENNMAEYNGLSNVVMEKINLFSDRKESPILSYVRFEASDLITPRSLVCRIL